MELASGGAMLVVDNIIVWIDQIFPNMNLALIYCF